MAAARAVKGQRSWRWSNTRTLNFLGWLNSKAVTYGKHPNTHIKDNQKAEASKYVQKRHGKPLPIPNQRSSRGTVKSLCWDSKGPGQDRTNHAYLPVPKYCPI